MGMSLGAYELNHECATVLELIMIYYELISKDDFEHCT